MPAAIAGSSGAPCQSCAYTELTVSAPLVCGIFGGYLLCLDFSEVGAHIIGELYT
jgi:hypothetical protein